MLPLTLVMLWFTGKYNFLSSTLIEFGDCAFGNCMNLKSVILNKGLYYTIGRDEFNSCLSLESIQMCQLFQSD